MLSPTKKIEEIGLFRFIKIHRFFVFFFVVFFFFFLNILFCFFKYGVETIWIY